MKTPFYELTIFLLVITLFSCKTQDNIDWKKYDVITNIDELVDYYPSLHLDRTGKYEMAEITKYIDGSKELVYEYEFYEDEIHDPLYYSVTIETTGSTKDAKESFGITKSALIAGNRLGSMRLQEVEIELPGAQNYYAIRTLDDEPNGILYITRRGTNVYSLIISGLYTEDHSIILDLINPDIESLGTFKL